MNALVGIDMTEVTRLTRAGRVTEATALLQRGLSGEPAASSTCGNSSGPANVTKRLDLTRPSTPNGTWRLEPAPKADEVDASAPHPSRPLDGFKPFRTRLRPRGPLGKQIENPLPPGARFETLAVSNAAGRLAYKLYVPSGHRGEPLPLVVMLHGCTQSAEDFAAGTRMNALAEESSLLVAYPEQSRQANSSGCWNWFKPGDQRRDGGEPSLIADVARQVIGDRRVDRSRVFIAGLSAGGAAAAIMAQEYPDLFAGVCVHSGLACGIASDLPSALAAMRGAAPFATSPRPGTPAPMIVFHGSADKTVAPVNARHLVQQFEPRDGTTRSVEEGRSAGGLGYTRTLETDRAGTVRLEQWLLHGVGHAWSGGSPRGSYTDRRGPDASREMMRFFLQLPGGGSPPPER